MINTRKRILLNLKEMLTIKLAMGAKLLRNKNNQITRMHSSIRIQTIGLLGILIKMTQTTLFKAKMSMISN
jgi:hypothetical protein